MSSNLPPNNPLAYVGIKETNPPQLYFRDRAPTAADARPYDIGDMWIDQVADEAYILVKKIGAVATWVGCAGTGAAETLTGNTGGAVGPDIAENINILGAGGLTVDGNPGTNTLTVSPSGGGTVVETLTGDSGGAISPDAINHNINILGNSPGFQNGIQFAGTPGNNTLTGKNLRDFTTFVVDTTPGETEYTTIQSAIDAANAVGGGVVQVREGTYTENLTIYADIHVQGSTLATTIIGTHIPPNSGNISFIGLFMVATGGNSILATAGATGAIILLLNCLIAVNNGYTFNLPNATGILVYVNNLESVTSGNNGFINCTGGALVIFSSAIAGAGTLNPAVLSNGTLSMFTGSLLVPITLGGSITASITGGSNTSPITTSGTAAVTVIGSNITGGTAVAITHNSPNPMILSNVTINSTAAPDVITGAGAVQFGSVVFTQGTGINAGITKVNAPFTRSGPFDIGATTSAAANDAYNRFYIPGSTEYAWGIDNSDTDKFKMTTGATPSAGTTLFQIDPTPAVPLFDPSFFFQGQYTLLQETIIGSSVDLSVANLDNTNIASDAVMAVSVGGASAGDPYFAWEVAGTNGYVIGMDNSDSDKLKIATGLGLTPSSGTTLWTMTTAGERTMPLQPAFLAYLTASDANVTGNNTAYTIAPYDVETFDQNADFNITTGIFTAPVTGRYRFCSNIVMSVTTSTSGYLDFVTSNGTYRCDYLSPTAVKDAANFMAHDASTLADMDAADTCTLSVTHNGAGADNEAVYGDGTNRNTFFTGQLEI